MNKSEETQLAVLGNDIKHIKDRVDKIDERLEKQYVMKPVFDIRVGRLEKIVYGMAGLILVAFFGFLITAVMGQ